MQIGIYTILVACLAGTGFAAPLDARQTEDLANDVSDVAGMATDMASGAVDGAVGTATGVVEGATGALSGLGDPVKGATGALGGLGDTVGGATGPLSGLGDTVRGATDTLGGLTGSSGSTGGLGGLLGGLTGRDEMGDGGADGDTDDMDQGGMEDAEDTAGSAGDAASGALMGATGAAGSLTSGLGGLGGASDALSGLTGSVGGLTNGAGSSGGSDLLGGLLGGLLGQKMAEMEQMNNEKRQLDAVSGLAGGLTGGSGSPLDTLSGLPVLGPLLSSLLGQKLAEMEQMNNEKRQLDAVSGLAGGLTGGSGSPLDTLSGLPGLGPLLSSLLGQKLTEMEQMNNEKRQLDAVSGLAGGLTGGSGSPLDTLSGLPGLGPLLSSLLGQKLTEMEQMNNEKRQLDAVSGLAGGLTGGSGSPLDTLSGLPGLGPLLSSLLGQKLTEMEQMNNEKRQLAAVSGLAGGLTGGDSKGLLGLGLLGILRRAAENEQMQN
ncbi:uncharacterized protein J7T54_002618 [Emericellopsis cladophorae]|uniref:Uncharacterized protein n=1 Tax=Emericellopsis cladophorae TaxID=2686198 RepID=A0A9P9XW79_9HYPO|nr:uncharacterized protein J7T54_002618 [Emericellopsis cladophorae]KAI6778976.1 hypothetical protein J7T54_002618 [Emericellopsis cladophorae]